MLVEFTIGSGPPLTERAFRLTLEPVLETRQGLKGVFEFLMAAQRWLDHDEFFVLRTADTIGAAGKSLVWGVSQKVLGRPLLILDGGVDPATLTNAQIRNRMGL